VEKELFKTKIIESITEKYTFLKEDILITKKISGVDSEYYEIVCELLGKLLGKFVWLSFGGSAIEENDILNLKVGEDFDIKRITTMGYDRVERVWNEGELSVLGDVVLIWPHSMNSLLRLSILGEKVESIDIVDVDSRRKIKSVNERYILSSSSKLLVGNEESTNTINIRLTEGVGDGYEEEAVNMGIRRIPGLESYTSKRAVIEIVKNFKSRGYQIWYISSSPEKYDFNVSKELRESIDMLFSPTNSFEKGINRGFVSSMGKVLVLTDLEVLGQIDLSMYEKKNIKIDPGSVEILKKIIPGDYLVHEDHGIGRFVNLVKREHGPYIEIAYAGKDKLFIPLTSSEKLTKYIGAGKKKPLLTGLNSGVWKRISKKAKERVEDIAKELLQLYALRESSKTPIIIDNDDSLNELNIFVEQFEFEDTDDQVLATKNIIDDLSNNKPMDRLLVGDVGYGKTEIAARAMFAVVNAGFQVALLAPTTILVDQHISVLKERFKEYPFNIAGLSRFSNKGEREKVKEDLKKGKIDIVVGTHALLSKDVSFKNLGLLVVDEEQKFGVKQKEEIKSKRVDTNVLSLTATPIPRTLNMALMGIRDISVLATPPLGRREILNYFETFNWDSIKSAISKELARNGQIYFLHNRVNTIEFVFSKLVKMFPNAHIAVAHGQMGAQKLSKTMKKFVEGEIDILVCTTIIENGLDIQKVNTLIIDDSTMLGLSQMYQIRGRIGRSRKQAYAYFYYSHLKGDSLLRLEAIKESQELGSGFLLSNKDLEIRGAGDILGKNQSGTINSVGYGLYSYMLEEAVKKVLDMGK
jgi:transcription-repair coupling factor (superfamily II helicase)